MRIGDFAKKYGMNVTAVRYYIENALLTPQRVNNQYVFDQNCIDDMDKILEYKKCGLSLEEIEMLFFLEKTSRFRDETILQITQELFENKIADFKAEEERLQESIRMLEEHLKRFSDVKIVPQTDSVWGIPFSFIPYLYCPECGVPLSMDNTRIHNNQIFEGELNCGCGYHARISNGVILCDDHVEDTPFKMFNNVDSVLSATDEYSGVYRILLDKASMYMYQKMPLCDYSQHVMFGPFTCNCLLRFCEVMNKNHIYIIIDPSLNRIDRLREYLAETDLQMVFIAGNIDDIPLRKASVDIYMDDYSVTNSLFTYGHFIYDKINPLLKDTGLILGVLGDYKDAPGSAKNIRKDHPDYPVEKLSPKQFSANMKFNGFKVEEMKLIGSTHGKDAHFPRHIVGEQVSMLGYVAVKNEEKR